MALSSETVETIRRNKIRYCRFFDTHQWQMFDTIVSPEATLAFHNADGSVMNENGLKYSFSREEFKKFFSNAHTNTQTIHLIDSGDLEADGPDTVKAIWTVIYHNGPTDNSGRKFGAGGGHYEEVWKQNGNEWLLQDMKFTRRYWDL